MTELSRNVFTQLSRMFSHLRRPPVSTPRHAVASLRRRLHLQLAPPPLALLLLLQQPRIRGRVMLQQPRIRGRVLPGEAVARPGRRRPGGRRRGFPAAGCGQTLPDL